LYFCRLNTNVIENLKRNSKITRSALINSILDKNSDIKTEKYDLRLFRPWVPDLGYFLLYNKAYLT